MNIIIAIAVLALCAGLGYAYWSICRGKELVEGIRQEADRESWLAAQTVASRTNPQALEAACANFVRARDAMHRSFNGGNAANVEHCWVDVQMANEHIEHTVSQDELARMAFDKVQNLYGMVLGQVWAHPTRAFKIYPTLKVKVKAIVDGLVAEYQGFELEEADRFSLLPQISQSELREHKKAIEGGDFFKWL
jgi:hypothetical protein